MVSWMLAGCASNGTGAPPADAGLDSSDGASDTGPTGDGGDGGSPEAADCGTLVWSTPACATCTSQSCCGAEALCAAIPSCAPLSACWNGCGADAGCTSACGSQYAAAISNYNAILNCQSEYCSMACPP